MGTLENMLGIDPEDDLHVRAKQLLDSDEGLLLDLVQIRLDRHLTQAEVGKIIGVSQATVAEFERSGNDPRLSTVRRYALAVGAQVHHMVFRSGQTAASEWAQSKTSRRQLAGEYYQGAVRVHARRTSGHG